jgi:hypothetical protein
MTPLRLSRLSGFGSKPPQDFDWSPISFGTASSCSVRFDAALDKGVGSQHCRLEWNGEAWWLLDGGTPAGTWVDGRRLAQPQEIAGAVIVSLGHAGPKFIVEPYTISDVPEATPSGSGDQTLASPVIEARRRVPHLIVGAAIATFIALLTGVGAMCFFLFKKGEHYQVIDALQPLPEAQITSTVIPPQQESPIAEIDATSPTPDPGTAPASVAPNGEMPNSTQTDSAVSPLPPETQAGVAKFKKEDFLHVALMDFWRKENSRSPYVQGILRCEDLWLANQMVWLKRFYDSRKASTGQGLDFPGAFVPEAIYSDASALGVPMMPKSLVETLGAAIAEGASGADDSAGQIAGRVARRNLVIGGSGAFSVSANQMDVVPSKAPLQKTFSTFTGKSTSPESPAKAWAVLVGINRFDGGDPEQAGNNLVGCRNDAGALAKILMMQGIFSPETTRVLTDTRVSTPDFPSKANILSALRETIEKAGSNDVIFVGFSTHGMYDEHRKDSALIPVDYARTGEPIWGSELTELLSKSQAKNMVIVMDACHTGGMASMGGTQAFTLRGAVSRDGTAIPESFYERLGASRGHVVIRACRSDQTTPDVRSLGQGILTALLVSGLTGDADADKDGIVTLSELRIYVTTSIPQITGRELEMRKAAGDDIGDETPLQPTFTSSSFGEAGDLPLTIVSPSHP